ncbi:hypothetical protein [Bosea sp. AS-1]|jgi:hypothetical protein|uniref:hypothetical protein n=1 Tax=Bosea sp. AS-1 TaxID=2015316 RepID=UPI000B7791C2|nr:hypothetical protein [Bosea sp. AS-1]
MTMNDELRDYLTGIASAQISLFGLLVDHLEREGILDKSKLSGELQNIMKISEHSEKPLQRYQAMVFDQVINWLASGKPQWTPVVIQGDGQPHPDSDRQNAVQG